MTDTNVNAMLRGELAATQTYQQALETLNDDDSLASQLRAIHEEHRAAANKLRTYAHSIGTEPTRHSGAWGTFAMIFEGTAALFGVAATLKALKRGEEYGLQKYERILQRHQCSPDCENIIGSTLLPQTRAHIAILDHMMAAGH